MYLKNLTVLGFKSFADKTSLNFQPGVTAIVGPNGCGKSNVSDAIRWVLGEQSAKALRGGEMADVIFNGTDGRKPMGMAEVSLTIGGVDEEQLRAAGVELSYNEVTLTRRVFRDGGSEYFINRTPCRLKDVQQLFMGTGMGKTSYSIMAQGNITAILSTKPEDRRTIFEEAAGITKFKSQKKESLRKLEATEQNLLRVADLIREVKRQIGSLQRQAGKARRYKQIQIELQHLDTQLARHQLDVLLGEIREKQSAADTLRNEIETGSADVLRFEDEIGQLRSRLAELEHEISITQQRGLELKSEMDRHESRIQFNEERLAEFATQNTKATADITEAEERNRFATDELASVKERMAASEATLAKHKQALQTRQAALQKIEDDIRGGQEQLRQAQSDAFAAAQDLTRVRNEINALDLQKQGNVVRLEKLSAEKIQLEEERSGLETRLATFAANVETEKLSVATKRGSVEQRQARLKELQAELQQSSTEQDQLLQQQAEKRSRLNVLEQLQGSHEGFSAGAVAALRKSRSVIGSLADKIRVPDQYVVAIENALGHHLQLVLTEQPESAQQILAELATSKVGRASVAALSIEHKDDKQLAFAGELAPGESGSEAKPLVEGEVVHALSVVRTEPSVEKLLKSLLGRTFIASDLSTATAQIQNGHAGCDFVTLGGDLLSRHGIYTGGYLNGNGNPKAPASILGRKNQISELQSSVTEIQEKVAEASRKRGALLSEQTELQASLQEAQNELRVQEVAIATREGEFNALENSRRLLHQKIDTVVYEVTSLAAQEKEGNDKRAALVERANGLDAREKAAQEKVATLTANLDAFRHQRDTATTTLTESKVALATEEQMSASFRQQLQSLEQRVRELAQIIEQRKSEISSFIARKAQAESEIADSRAKMDSLSHDREQVNAQAAELLGRKQAQDADVLARDEALREQRRRLTQLQDQRGAIDVELAQKNMSAQNLRERIQQKYHLNLDDVRSECITITYADEGAPKVQTLTPEEMAASGVGTDWDAVARQVEELQKRLDEMGPVNLVAIEEYEETEQRHQFLSAQHDDLVSAKAQLLEVINRINTQTKEMFTTTFNQIRDNFRLMFTEVFGGGKADLILTDENDVLESGIDIVAKPPGKQLQTISLLSGGEQTMTAVSLLFSIYQVKPSPFCVLDELDAPLDESNINRFIRVLQRFIAHSQFIIITHNKRTIGMADVLYGVTMEEHGVSKIVSVKFHKAGEAVTQTGTAPVSIETPVTGRLVEQEEDEPHRRGETLEIAVAAQTAASVSSETQPRV
ncbi:MAG: chromosome segregation protein SMC [Verrucomicrobia bacterium]|nr:MAG: chromosome segregation protein SMC [Verrucomicrobiota bacterium]